MSVTELLGGAIGVLLLGRGTKCTVAWSIGRRASDGVLLLFGVWTALYGARLVAEQSAIVATLSILLFTDGVPEAQSPGGKFLDVERMRAWMTSPHSASAEQRADAHVRTLRDWRVLQCSRTT